MEEKELNLQERIEQEAKKTLRKTMWEGYANDILTGLQKNPGIQPDRPIWELVQNARDVSYEKGKAQVVFTRKQNSFVFQHNGQPFTRTTLQSLILQTSSKVREDIIQVGQYGTGFLTTHKFGLDFRLTGSLSLLNGLKFYNFLGSDFIIKRSAQDKTRLSEELDATIAKTQQWGLDLGSLEDNSKSETIFEYQHNFDIERENVRIAIKEAPKLVPFVLALNKHIESICFVDEVEQSFESFIFQGEEVYDTLDDLCVYEATILHSKNGQKNESINLFLLKSLTCLENKTKESLFTVVLPFKNTIEGLKVFGFDDDIPRLFLYLPLLGSKNFGCNFLFHSPSFTCDQDSRDSLMLRFNPQAEVQFDQKNKEIIKKTDEALRKYLLYKYQNLKDARLLCPVNFVKGKSADEVSMYYRDLQREWVSFFECLNLVEKENGETVPVQSIRVLNNELYLACEQDAELLDALYDLLSKAVHKLYLPKKEEMLFWSKITNEWYEGDDFKNQHAVSMEDVVDMIQNTAITEVDLNWLHKLCDYFKQNRHADYLNKPIIPNEEYVLCVQKDLVKPANFGNQLKAILKILTPESVKKFVHSRFVDIVEEGANNFDKAELCIALGSYFDKLESYDDILKNAIIAENKINLDWYSEKRIPHDEIHAIMDLYKMLVANSTGGFPERCFNLLSEYYGYYPTTSEEATKEVLDVRKCYNALLNDVLLGFTLEKNKDCKGNWILRMVMELFKFKDTHNFLRNYQVYPNQIGIYKYASQLKKEEVGMPQRLKELYNEICNRDNVRIEDDLVNNDFASYFVESTVLKTQELADRIQEPFKGDDGRRTIANDVHQKQYLEIIERFNNPEDGCVWKNIFPIINQIRPYLMLSVIDSPQKQESIFTIMKVEDEVKLQKIADLAKNPKFDRIIALGEEALVKEEREINDLGFKKELGTIVEKVLLDELNDVLGKNKLETPLVKNKQGGQDLILQINDTPIYYIEVKSRWSSDKSVLMTTQQHKTSYKEKEHYALCAADMTLFLDRARKHEYPPFMQIENNLVFITNIGELNDRLKDATLEEDRLVYIAGGYQVVVPQEVIRKYGISFRVFIELLKNKVKEAIA